MVNMGTADGLPQAVGQMDALLGSEPIAPSDA